MKATSIGELEKQIMDIVWEYNECSGRDGLNKLGKERKLVNGKANTDFENYLMKDKDTIEIRYEQTNKDGR